MKPRILVIAGPTASGKTALGVEMALKLNGEVISADSMQIYKGMDVATAKPTTEEMKGVPHHLIGFLDRTVNFSVADYVDLAGNSYTYQCDKKRKISYPAENFLLWSEVQDFIYHLL